MAASDHAHDFEALDRGIGRLHRLEAPCGTDQPFERTMIGLDPVVEILRRPVPDGVFQLALSFQPAQCLRIGAKLVGGDRHRRPVTHDLQRLGQKAAGRHGVPAVGQHEIDQTSVLVDGPEQVFPLATHPGSEGPSA